MSARVLLKELKEAVEADTKSILSGKLDPVQYAVACARREVNAKVYAKLLDLLEELP